MHISKNNQFYYLIKFIQINTRDYFKILVSILKLKKQKKKKKLHLEPISYNQTKKLNRMELCYLKKTFEVVAIVYFLKCP